MKNKELLMSVSIHDCEVSTFRAGGPGGQNQNKVASAVRIVHRPSGAIGISRDERGQLTNKRIALKRLAYSKEFQAWAKLQAASEIEVLAQIADLERKIGKENIRTEALIRGRWEII